MDGTAADLIAYRAQLAPSPWYLRIDDNLRITSYNSLAAVKLTIRSRVLTLNGDVDVSSDGQTPNTDRTAKSSVVATPEGWLLGGQVFVSAAAPQTGQTFVVVEVVRGATAVGMATQVLAAGYVTAKQPLRFPDAQIGSSLDSAGALRAILTSTPGGGAEISDTVPTGARWELISWCAQFVTSVTIANRQCQLILDDGANILYRLSATAAQTASTTFRRQWHQGASSYIVDPSNNAVLPLPINNRLGPGFRIRTLTGGIDVSDQWSAGVMLVREWIEGA